MSRARNIKPGFFKNEELAELPFEARLLFIGLWCLADREGRLEDRPKRIKIEIFPGDSLDAEAVIQSLADRGLIIRYEVGGARYIQIPTFTKHQNPHYKEPNSAIPAPQGHKDSGTTGGGVSEAVRLSVLERDGHKCVSCQCETDLTVDHIVPRSKGGSHEESNLQTLCRRCNSTKNNRSSANHRPIIGQSSNDEEGVNPADSLIPDSLIPDSKEEHSLSTASPSDGAGAKPKPADIASKRAERISTITADAIDAYNQILGKPNGLLRAVRASVGIDTRREQVKRCLKTASEICQELYGDSRITAEFWGAYFDSASEDDFHSGKGPYSGEHANWRPDFEFLTRKKTMLTLFDRAVDEDEEAA